MMLLPHERATITKAFHCEVTNQYGCEEVGLIACECETHEGLHLNVDHLYIEFIRSDGSPAVPGEESEIVVTDLINKGMPLIRYRIEDIASPATRTCSCGRGLPLMEKVTGRTADFLVRTDGGLVAGVSLVERTLTKIRGIEQMQIVQDDIHRITVRVVRDGAYDRKSEEELLDEFRSVFGPLVQIEVHYLERLPQSPSGKYRFAECRVRSTKLSL
jgi:phenylacetate-CoA ligase